MESVLGIREDLKQFITRAEQDYGIKVRVLGPQLTWIHKGCKLPDGNKELSETIPGLHKIDVTRLWEHMLVHEAQKPPPSHWE